MSFELPEGYEKYDHKFHYKKRADNEVCKCSHLKTEHTNGSYKTGSKCNVDGCKCGMYRFKMYVKKIVPGEVYKEKKPKRPYFKMREFITNFD